MRAFFASIADMTTKTLSGAAVAIASLSASGPAEATNFTTTVPGTGITLPDEYPEAGGVAVVMVGQNGNIYYQFSNPANAFVGFQNNPNRPELGGNPFTINDPLALDCGFASCTDYFGGGIANLYIRFSAFDGDTQVGGFDQNDITLRINGFDVGNWSGRQTERTNTAGTQSFGFENGFGNNSFNTGWFSSTNAALLQNLLDTGQTTTQVFDRDPNDNFWNFQRGQNLDNNDIVTVAPGYTIEKTADVTNFTAVGQVVNYTYVVENIGSVPIRNLTVNDDRVPTVTCDKTTIQDSPSGAPAPDRATCTGTYTITQADFDSQSVTNIARANGDPDFGQLGEVSDTVTITGPAGTPGVEVLKTTTLSNFGAAGSTVPYTIGVRNSGDVTLTNIVVSDDLIPGFSCTIPTLAPGVTDTSCTTTYTVTQSDVDAFAASGTPITNVARASGTSAQGGTVSDADTDTLNGSTPDPTFTLAKSPLASGFSTLNEVVQYQIQVTNTSGVTFPGPPTLTDSLGITVNCPAGTIAPSATITCSASYSVTQNDLDTGTINNTVDGTITVGGQTRTASSSAVLNGTRTLSLTMVKQLAASSPTSFDDINQTLSFEYVLTNQGNVVLQSPAVTDDKTTVNCPTGDIAPGASITCTATYSTIQADLQAGGVTNLATASTTAAGAGETVQSDEESLTVPAVQNSGLTLVKTGAQPASFAVGQTITYTFDVTNSGNIEIPGPVSITDDKIGTFQCFAGNLARGATQSCTANYTLTAIDVGNGAVTNMATASNGTTTSPEANETITNSATPGITITKAAETNPIGATDTTVRYRFFITNTGDAQIIEANSPITITDDKIGAPFVCAGRQPSILNPGDSYDCARNYSPITQAERDAGEVVNTASASFPFNTGTGTITVTAPEVIEVTPITPVTTMTFDKVGPAQFNPGETITYTFNVTNTGSVTLSIVLVTDDNIPGLNCPITDLAPGASTSCTGDYIVTQADVDAGTLTNNASATGQTAQGTQVTETDSETSTLNPANDISTFSVSKTANTAAFSAVGDVITYTIDVVNTGTKTLSNIDITDVLDPTFSCSIASLAPGANNDLCRFNYTVTQDDIDAGSIGNTASAVNPDFGPVTSSVSVPGPARDAQLSVTKTALGGYTVDGDTVDFRITVENTGNVRVNGVTVTDASIFSPPATCNLGTLEPGQIDNSCVVTYTVNQTDVDNGSVGNTADVTGTGADSTAINESASATATGPAENASVSVTKTSADGTYTSATDTELFTFSVTNTGNVTLTNLVLTDREPDGTVTRTCALADLLPGATATTCADTSQLQFTKTFDQADVDAGSYTNTATIVGESLVNGTAVDDTDDETVTGPSQSPSISLAKSESFAGDFSAIGQVIDYSYLITNNGNITLTAPISVDDSVTSRTPNAPVAVNCPALPSGGLPVGGTLTCTASYTVTQEDLDNGAITNTATGTLNQPVIPQNPGDPSSVTVTSPPDSVTVNATQTPSIEIAKAVASGSATTYSDVGDTITFAYTVTNTGNTTITDPITVTDDQITGTANCLPVPLAPGADATCQLVWVAEQADIDAGSVTNLASATAGPTSTGTPATATVFANQQPELAMVKEFVSGSFAVGQSINYRYVVTNEGNTTINLPVTVTDDKISSVSCAPNSGTLEPRRTNATAEVVCTGSYTVTAGDADLGAVTNLASVSDGTTTSPTVSETVPTSANPSLSLNKEVTSGANFTAVGDVVEYLFTVANDTPAPGAPFSAIIEIVDPDIGTFTCYDPATDGGPLNSINNGASPVTCTASYTIQQADLDRGQFVNEAFATTIFAPGNPSLRTTVNSPPDTATSTATTSPALTVAKSVTSGPNPAAVSDTLTYQILTTNTGNQTISDVMVSDPKVGTLTCTVDNGGGPVPAPTPVVLGPTEALTCTGSYIVTQADVDNNGVDNIATATGNNPQGGSVSTTGTNTHPVVGANASLAVTKRIDPVPASPTDPVYTALGQSVDFVVEVQNDGNVTLDNIVVDDPLTGGTCNIASLAPGQSDTSCTFTFGPITQAEIDAGSFDNTANATGSPRSGGPNATGSGTVTAFGPASDPGFALSKVATTADFAAVGDIVSYTFTVANAGNVTLFAQPVINDDKIGTFNCGTIPPGGLAPVEFVTCTADYPVTQADVDAGFVTNNASATSTEVTTPATATATVNSNRTPGVNITKSAVPSTNAAVGDVIAYTYQVENTGNVTLTAVTVGDDHTSASGTAALTIAGDALVADNGVANDSSDGGANGVWDTLAPGDIVSFTSSYTVTQQDVDTGTVLSNTATVTATPPTGTTPPTSTTTVTVPPVAPAPSLTALKSVSGSTGTVAGSTVSFDISVENDGNVTLTAPVLTDTLRRTDGTLITPAPTPAFTGGDAGVAGQMEVGEIWTYTVSYTLTQADVDAGGISNSVLAQANAPDGTPTEDLSGNGQPGGDDSPTPFAIAPTPSIIGEKTITSGTAVVGQTIVFRITATNNGNVTLTGVGVNDTLTRIGGTPLTLGSGPSFVSSSQGSTSGVLVPGETATYSASYTLVQADIDAGGISNTATVTGAPPVGTPVSDITDDGNDGDGNTQDDPTELLVPAAPGLSVDKRLAAGDPSSYNTLGQAINFEFEVANTGNVTLAGPFSITDPLITDAGGTITCAPGPIAPGASLLCTGSYTVTQPDLDAGSLTNVASATDGTTTSPNDSITVPAVQTPAMTVDKSAGTVASGDFVVGAVIDYTYVVTNSGNTTLTDPITITDNRIPSVTCDALPAGGLLPTGTLNCTGSYTIISDDVDLGEVTNLASSVSGTTSSPTVSETIPETGVPSLSITKTPAPSSTFAAPGDIINYTFVIENDGTRSFASVVQVVDDRIGTFDCFVPVPATNPDLTPGETFTCTANYTVTQDDLDAGEVVNEAFATTTFGPSSTPVVSAPQTATVTADLTPGLTLSKSSAPNPAGPVGSIVTYTLIATNTGNQTLNTVEISDPLLPALVCQAPTLAIGATLNCTETYTVTQDNIDAGILQNTATVTGLTPQGTPVTPVTANVTTGVPASAPSLTVLKSVNPTTLGPVGTDLTYSFRVENTGNTTLSNINVNDALDPAAPCTISTLAPGAVDDFTCSFMLTVTQDMIDAGELVNTVNVAATDPFGNSVTGTDTLTTPGPTRVPGIEATKVAISTSDALGDPVVYQLQLVNTGNVSLTVTGVTDTMTRLDGFPSALDAPFALVSGDTDGDNLLDVTETWIYQAQHTITQSDINSGGLQNTVSVTATGAGGGTTSDVSDDGDDGDGNTADDPTIFEITSAPEITTVKTVETSGSAAGDVVTFLIVATNTGNVDITNVTITDELRRADNALITPAPTPVNLSGTTDLNAGAAIQWRVSYTLTQDDVDAGGLNNSATVTGEDPSGDPVTDVSSDDDPFDGNPDDDVTELVISPTPGLDVVKTFTTSGSVAGDVVEFTIAARNTGNVSLDNITVSDTLERIDGTPLSVDAVTFQNGSLGSVEGDILVTETATYLVTYTLVQEDIDAGGIRNSATVTGTSPLGGVVSDVSDDGDDGDGNTTDDPTLGPITAAPANTLMKTASDPVPLFPQVFQTTFTLTVTNTGNITQDGYQVTDSLASFAGTADILTDPPFALDVRVAGFTGGGANTGYDGAANATLLTGNPSLAPGQIGTIEIDLVYSVENGGATGTNVANVTSTQLTTPVQGTAVVAVTDTDGDGLPDGLEGCGPGDDRDGDGICDREDFDPTGYFYCEDDGRILPGGTISVSGSAGTQTGVGTSNNITIVQDGSVDGQFVFFVSRPGTYTLTPTYPSLGSPSTTRLSSGTLDVSTRLPGPIASIGSSEFGNTGRLADSTAGANPFFLSFEFEAGDPFVINNNLPLQNCQGIPDISATKTSDRDSAVFGETVNFTLEFANNTSNALTNVNLVDILPPGMLYTPGSGAVDGVATEPVVSGLRLEWPIANIAQTQTVRVTLAARVVANGSYGELTNRAFMTDAAGNVLSNVATAVVRIEPEHVFDCADIIGKVFDDKNQNGYQDEGEPGLPGVRLATLRGNLITTDEYGRYHVPCAELPENIGSNFTLKLDTRTLPTGYRVTTENPRVIRVTAGKFAKLNFGAALSNVVDVDLTAAAFVANSNEPTEALERGVEGLLDRIRTTPSVLRISYILRDEDRKLATARLKAVEALIRDRWRGAGRYKLNVERTIKRVQ